MTPQSIQPTRQYRLAAAVFLMASLSAADHVSPSPASLPTAEEVVERMRAADLARSEQLLGYTATRVYQLDNHRFRKQARIVARVTYRHPGEKRFDVISEEGSRLICDRVLRRVIGAEVSASQESNRDLARINLVNYHLKMLGTDTADGRTCYLLALEPKSRGPYLVKGRAWIDVDEYALARLEGVVAKKPSVWAGAPVVCQTYFKLGPFWLPDKNLSTTDAPVFGKTDLAIETSGYQLRGAPESEAPALKAGN